jgi:hypothetical protein
VEFAAHADDPPITVRGGSWGRRRSQVVRPIQGASAAGGTGRGQLPGPGCCSSGVWSWRTRSWPAPGSAARLSQVGRSGAKVREVRIRRRRFSSSSSSSRAS